MRISLEVEPRAALHAGGDEGGEAPGAAAHRFAGPVSEPAADVAGASARRTVRCSQLAAQLQERGTRTLTLVLHEQESVGLMSLAGPLRGASADGLEEIIVIVGPEGGIDEAELDVLRGAGARTMLLGPEVLRTSTAGPAALAVISALVGRWS